MVTFNTSKHKTCSYYINKKNEYCICRGHVPPTFTVLKFYFLEYIVIMKNAMLLCQTGYYDDIFNVYIIILPKIYASWRTSGLYMLISRRLYLNKRRILPKKISNQGKHRTESKNFISSRILISCY